jgi:hypothetical protein
MTEQGVFYNAKVDRVYRARETYNVLYTDNVESFCTAVIIFFYSHLSNMILFLYACVCSRTFWHHVTLVFLLDPKMAFFEWYAKHLKYCEELEIDVNQQVFIPTNGGGWQMKKNKEKRVEK